MKVTPSCSLHFCVIILSCPTHTFCSPELNLVSYAHLPFIIFVPTFSNLNLSISGLSELLPLGEDKTHLFVILVSTHFSHTLPNLTILELYLSTRPFVHFKRFTHQNFGPIRPQPSFCFVFCFVPSCSLC